ncbi:hypothetical protein [Mammaliicoccus fleurettii]|uniref:hypothetical protein n=1 Tax=Mammaliicoccus fleurettii TaxID=150056 RepID=UPI002DBD8A40|nr:hypothetical protein [Mammaliicoccus fleurettii]MEB8067701.1 hypothetical protein [Mammaliicoccus fleurettii]
MKYCYDDLFYIITNYRWIKETIIQSEILIEHSKSNDFLMKMNENKIDEVNELKAKINYIDEHVELIADKKTYWIINLLMEGTPKKKIKKIMKISHETLMKKVDEGIEIILKYEREYKQVAK